MCKPSSGGRVCDSCCSEQENILLLSPELWRNSFIPKQSIPARSQHRWGAIWRGISEKSLRKEDAGFSSPLSSHIGSTPGGGKERASKSAGQEGPRADVVGGGSGWEGVHVTRAGRGIFCTLQSWPGVGVAIVCHANTLQKWRWLFRPEEKAEAEVGERSYWQVSGCSAPWLQSRPRPSGLGVPGDPLTHLPHKLCPRRA